MVTTMGAATTEAMVTIVGMGIEDMEDTATAITAGDERSRGIAAEYHAAGSEGGAIAVNALTNKIRGKRIQGHGLP